MHLAMMTAAERDREFIADFSAQSRGLCKTEVMGIGGAAAANQTRLLGDRFDVVPIANATWRR